MQKKLQSTIFICGIFRQPQNISSQSVSHSVSQIFEKVETAAAYMLFAVIVHKISMNFSHIEAVED